ncbi:hypothetical protein EZJ43_06395 [Pedobacter changchengzhani]|uniref:Uncharacterized protein n=1 Tax=Pedobacter changchengzhani TaxID=2529274 RepID=A0A4R5MNK8_9SPHI|nr:hypothetical protein [Pedobacter changchengzhani]TDG36905.1 hypothetical protein EZJ43_06395 [Pedobacter changchengzhani]
MKQANATFGKRLANFIKLNKIKSGFIVISILLFAFFSNAISLIFYGLINVAPPISKVETVRNFLLKQPNFVKLLHQHQQNTVNNRKKSALQMYLHKTSISVMISPVAEVLDFPKTYDTWQVWVKTDVIDGKPYTSFLVRIGTIKDEKSVNLFSNAQKNTFAKRFVGAFINGYNKLYDWEILHPIRYNITEMNATSNTDFKILQREDWEKLSYQQHLKGVGESY